jgi:hypothetical protein
MTPYSQHTGAPARCAFCAKPLPILNGELQIWRDTIGQFSPSGVRKVSRRVAAALSFGLKPRIPSRTNADLTRVISRLASLTSVSRSRLGRLASSSASIGTATVLQCPRSPRSQPRKPRLSGPCRADRSSLGDVRASPQRSMHE